MTWQFEKTVLEFFKSHNIDKGEPIVVAFSGGADSLSLLIALKSLGFTNIIPVYVNHNLRESSELEAELRLNRENASLLSLKLIVHEIERGRIKAGARTNAIGVEAEARRLRLELLEQEAKKAGAKYIATAHNRNDRDEWEIISFFRGSISGSTIKDFRPPYIRPLTRIKHEDCLTYIAKKGFVCSEDSTNQEAEHLRNRVRNELIPAIEAIFPSFSNTLETRRALLEMDNEKRVDFVSTTYFELPALLLETEPLYKASASCISESILKVLNTLGKSTNGGRFSSRNVRDIMELINYPNARTLLITDIYVFKTTYALKNESLVFIKKCDVDNAILNRDPSLLYSESGKARRIAKKAGCPSILRPLLCLK